VNSQIYKREMFIALEAVISEPTINTIQRKIRCGYTHAAQAMENLEELGIMSRKSLQKTRHMLISHDEARDIIDEFYEDTKSILTDDYSRCFIEGCNKPVATEHHIIEGNGVRSKSDEYGLKIPICEEHHRWCHQDAPKHPGFAEGLKIDAQLAFEKVHGTRQKFKKIFGRYYVNDGGL